MELAKAEVRGWSYYLRLANGEGVLVAVYAKARFDNMPVEILKSWKEIYDA